MRFIQFFKPLSLAILLSAIPYLIWDVLFTQHGVWGFNPEYYLGVKILGMPMEEWMFFYCIPYACIFSHYAINYFKPHWVLSDKLTKPLTFFLIVGSILLAFLHTDKLYTSINFFALALVLILGLRFNLKAVQQFYISFLFILFPFLLVNGILTGSFTENQVVWYNNAENLGIRIFTIPIEDFGYAFSLLFLSVLLFEFLKHKSWLNKTH
jgi:lycopene cyclase domain-containing protein